MAVAESPAGKGARPVRPVPHEIDTSRVPLEEAETAEDFGHCLDKARTLAGPLSNREIETRSGGLLGRTKIGQVLAGALPRREFLDLYLQVCGVPEPDRTRWYEAWERLAHAPRGSGSRRSGRTAEERAVAIIEQAEARAAQITAQATTLANEITTRANADVDHLMAQARADAERVRLSDDARIEAAEVERDSAMSRARALTLELDEMHQTSLERVRAADEERDAALARARSLAEELTAMHEAGLERIRAAEEERDAAIARARTLAMELDALYVKIAELREQLSTPRPGQPHHHADELEDARAEIARLRNQLTVISEGVSTKRSHRGDDIFSPDIMVAPPAIGG